MLQELSITIKNGELTHTISIDTSTDYTGNMAYNIADAIQEVVHLTNINPDILIEQLANVYGLSQNVMEEHMEEHGCFNMHPVSEEPESGRWVYVVSEDKETEGLIVVGLDGKYNGYNGPTWNEIIDAKKAKQWCYLNDILKSGFEVE